MSEHALESKGSVRYRRNRVSKRGALFIDITMDSVEYLDTKFV